MTGSSGGPTVDPTAQVHPTAELEAGVVVGARTAIWSYVHVRGPARIGAECIVGERTHVSYGVDIGDRCKLNTAVYVCTGVTMEQGVMVGAGTVFTNDRYPRATNPALSELRTSAPDQHTRPTRVHEGATIGAASVIGCDLEIGRFAMVGMGAVVTRAVPDFHLVVGNPARSVGAVCRCGEPLVRFATGRTVDAHELECRGCALTYAIRGGVVTELAPP